MNIFDKLVTEALENHKEYTSLRVVVEKELLHHDILRVLSQNDLLSNLTFIGCTALRACYGSSRLSEDLDFTGGKNFSKLLLKNFNKGLVAELYNKYGFLVNVSEPTQDKTNVSTWKIRIQTRPFNKDLPSQHINLNICSINSYEPKPMMLMNQYNIDMGTGGLILQVQSKEEILIDKIIALALRPRIKYRDLWDIVWLHQTSVQLKLSLIELKLKDHNSSTDIFKKLLNERLILISSSKEIQSGFISEMNRFLPDILFQTDKYWIFLTNTLTELTKQVIKYLN